MSLTGEGKENQLSQQLAVEIFPNTPHCVGSQEALPFFIYLGPSLVLGLACMTAYYVRCWQTA